MQQLEMAAAERQALHRREHAVQKAEENIAFMEHSADYKVRQAHHAAQATETQELQKAAAMEEKAEAQDSKSRADEQNAITVASSEKKEVANLKGENKKLRDKLKRMTQKEEQAVKEVTSEKVKMAAA